MWANPQWLDSLRFGGDLEEIGVFPQGLRWAVEVELDVVVQLCCAVGRRRERECIGGLFALCVFFCDSFRRGRECT